MDRMKARIRTIPGEPKNLQECTFHWIVLATATTPKEGDRICQLHGPTKPMIVRSQKKFFSIAMVIVNFDKEESLEVSRSLLIMPQARE